MILSHKYRFIFTKTRKTAGTSIEVYLSALCGSEDTLTPVDPPEAGHSPRNFARYFNPLPELWGLAREGQWRQIRQTVTDLRRQRCFYNHMPARRIKDRIARPIWNSYFKFCVERNPWDKMVSLYHFQKARKKVCSFAEMLPSAARYSDFDRYSQNNKILMDRVIRYENLHQELKEVLADLGIPFQNFERVRSKAGYRPSATPYQAYYNRTTRQMVADAFRREIAVLGYEFED